MSGGGRSSGRGGKTSTRASKWTFKVEDIRLTGTPKQIQYARDLIDGQFNATLNAHKSYIDKAEKERSEGHEIRAQSTLQNAKLYENSDVWAKQEIKKLAKSEWKAGDVIDALKGNYYVRDNPAKAFELSARWLNGERYNWNKKHSKKKK